jgi:hypothetical protein
MGYNNRKIILDAEGKPIPQYYNEATDQYEVVKGSNGATNVNVKNFPSNQNVTLTNTEIPIRSSGLADFTNGSVTVTSTQVELKVGTSPMSGRKQMIVYPPSSGTIYWGKSGVTPENGAPLSAEDDPLIFDFNPNVPISVYAVSDGTDRIIKVVEMK